MMNDNYFEPDAFMAQQDSLSDGILLTFEKDGAAGLRIVLTRPQFLQVAARLVELSASKTLTPISARDLQVGETFRTVFSQFRKNDDGSLRLVLGIELNDRVVTMPITLDAQSQAMLIDVLKA